MTHDPRSGAPRNVGATGEELDGDELDRLRRAGFTVDLLDLNPSLSKDEVREALLGYAYYLYGGIEAADSWVQSDFDALAGRGLKMIAFAGKGVDDFLKVPEALGAGIKVANTPGAVERSVAEFTVFLLLELLRDASLRASKWSNPAQPSRAFPDLGTDLLDVTVGIIGMGDIGQIVARMLRTAFGTRVVYWSRTRRRNLEVDLGIEYREQRELVAESDVLTVHLKNEEGTRSLMADFPLEIARPGSLLINTASERLIESQRLCMLLTDGPFRRAAFDKIYKADELLRSGLTELTPHKLYVTNHSANATAGAWRRMTRMAVDAILADAHADVAG